MNMGTHSKVSGFDSHSGEWVAFSLSGNKTRHVVSKIGRCVKNGMSYHQGLFAYHAISTIKVETKKIVTKIFVN